MPLFMDFHIIEGITIEGLKEGHVADKAVESKHGTRILQFWVNPDLGTVICLMEAPCKEACVAVHQESHGQIACKVEEVEPGFFHLFMGEDHRVEHGIVKQEDGSLDLGYRYIVNVNVQSIIPDIEPGKQNDLSLPYKVRSFIDQHLRNSGGKEVQTEDADSYTAVFKDAKIAVASAAELQRSLLEKSINPKEREWNIEFRIGITGGQPLTKEKGFFEEVMRTGKRLSFIAENKEIIISPLVKRQAGLEETFINSYLRILGNSEADFLRKLFNNVEQEIANDKLNVHFLSRAVGLSRPQLYRKTMSATGRAPSSFIRDLRMQKALFLVRKNQYNISEISLKVGINNPSYFTKCFKDRYGTTPSKVSN